MAVQCQTPLWYWYLKYTANTSWRTTECLFKTITVLHQQPLNNNNKKLPQKYTNQKWNFFYQASKNYSAWFGWIFLLGVRGYIFSILKTWRGVKRSLDILCEVKEQPRHLFLHLVPPFHLFLIRRNNVPSSLQSVKTVIGLAMHLKVMNRINRCEVLIFNLLQRRRSHLFHQRPSSLLSKYRSDYIYCQPF